MIWILLILLAFNLYGQSDKILPARKNTTGFDYTPVNVGSTVSEGQIIFSGAFIQTVTGVDSLSSYSRPTRYMGYGIGAITDSVSGISKILTTITEDTLYFWRESLSYTSKTSKVVYRTATIDTATSLLIPPVLVSLDIDEYPVLSWDDNSEQELQYIIERSVNSITYALYDSVNANISSYIDSSATPNDTLGYKIYAQGDYGNSTSTTADTIVYPLLELTFSLEVITEVFEETASDTTINFLAMNTSVDTITVDSTNYRGDDANATAAITVPDTSITLAPTDTLVFGITIKRSVAVGYKLGYTRFWTNTQDDSVYINVRIIPADTSASADAGCDAAVNNNISFPTGLTATGYLDSVVLTWTQVAGDSAVETYIMISDENDCCCHSVFHPNCDSTNAIGSTRWVWTSGFNQGSVYDFKLRLKDANGNVTGWSPTCDSVLVPVPPVADTTAPNPVASLDAEGFNENATPKTYYVLNWVAESSPSVDRAKYIIERCTTEGQNPCTAYSDLDSVNIGTLTYTDTTGSANNFYWFRVKVRDDSSNYSYNNPQDSATIPATIPSDVPAAPTSLTATSDTTTSDLAWTDNASNELAYLIERKLSTDGVYTQIDSIAANSTSYEFTGLLYNTTYNCRVRGVNAIGYSNYSNVATFTTVDTTGTGTNHYVDKNASGGNNGISWTNAWQSFADIDWSAISAGDILYISGGSDSTTYNETLVVLAENGVVGGRITITKGVDTGHNGKVIIDAQNTRSLCVDFDRNGSGVGDYVTLSYMTFKNPSSYSVRAEGRSGSYQLTGVTLDNITYENAGRTGVRSVYNDDFTISNFTYSTVSNTGSQTDGVVMTYCNDFLMENCNITINNSGTSHNDGFQKFKGYGYTNGIVRNNYFDLNNTDQVHSQGIFGEEFEGTWSVYNNVVDGHADVKALINFKLIGDNATVNVYNNTIISGDNVNGIVVRFIGESSVTVNFKNNIVVVTSASGNPLYTNNTTVNRDYNIWWVPNGSYPSAETNGYRIDPDLDANHKPDNVADPPVDTGVTLGLFTNDLDGVTRPQGSSWDIGAYEFVQ